MLEQKIDALTETIKDLTATIKAGGLAGAGKAATTAKDTKAADTKPAISADEMKKIALTYRDRFTPAVTTAVIKEVTGANKLAEVKAADFGKLAERMQADLDKPAEEEI